MKMTPKQVAVLQEISDGTVHLWFNGTNRNGERVVIARKADGGKVNLQVDFLVDKSLAVLGPIPMDNEEGQPVYILDRGWKHLVIAQNEQARV